MIRLHPRSHVVVALVALLLWPAARARAEAHHVFVTSVSGTGNLSTWANAGGQTGLAAGDAICKARAAAGGLPNSNNYVAWLSSSTTDAYCRVFGLTGKKSDDCGQLFTPSGAGPWERKDNYPFGETIEQILNAGRVYAPVTVTELGASVDAKVYTGTWIDGANVNPGDTCNNWTNGSSGLGGVGLTKGTTDAWTSSGTIGCGSSARLLCVEKGVGPALVEDFRVSGARLAFVTAAAGTGNLSSWSGAQGATGIAAGDAICRTSAANAGRPHAPSFKAWLSDASTNAIARLVGDGPWARPDGVPVAVVKTNLQNGLLFTSVGQDELAEYHGTDGVWTGTLPNGTKAAGLSCSNWASTAGNGQAGRANEAAAGWTSSPAGTQACNFGFAHLYCFSDVAVLTKPAQPIAVGTPITLNGNGITAGSRLKVFVATANGSVDVIPSGLAPTGTPTPTSWSATLPWPWPVGGANAKLLGNGFISLALVQTDLGFDMTDPVGAVLHGNAALAVPTILSLDTHVLSTTSSELSVGTANVEAVIPTNHIMNVSGGGFSNAVVNVFTAAGNIGPLTPTSQFPNTLNVMIPAGAPIGPGSIQVVNGGTFQASNAVSVPIGEAITVTSVLLNGNTVTVNGTGFNALTVVNLFAFSNGSLVNAGGLNPNGTPKIPLSIVNAHQFTFTRPGGLQNGGAYLQAINPPFIPFSNSGTGPGGAFNLT